MEVWSLAIPSHFGSLNIMRKYKFDKCKSFTREEAISKKKITSSSTGEEVNILGPWQICSSCFCTRCGADIVVETPCGARPSQPSVSPSTARAKRTGSARLPCWHPPACLQVSDCPQPGPPAWPSASQMLGWEAAEREQELMALSKLKSDHTPLCHHPPSHSMYRSRSLQWPRGI